MKDGKLRVALIGNPNTGKSSLFNQLTKRNQKVGNYPGVTVDRKEANFKLPNGTIAELIDLPGIYSLNPNSADENVVLDYLLDKGERSATDLVIVISDVENLKRNLLLFTQLSDLNIPTILAINRVDRLKARKIQLDIPKLEQALQSKVLLISAKTGEGIDELKTFIQNEKVLPSQGLVDIRSLETSFLQLMNLSSLDSSLYASWLTFTRKLALGNFSENPTNEDGEQIDKSAVRMLQQKEAILRHRFINNVLVNTVQNSSELQKQLRTKLDKLALHRVFGFVVFFGVLMLMFQAIYVWSSWPMNWIDEGFAELSQLIKRNLTEGMFTNLLAEGIVPGLGGIAIFIPQIVFLFLFISILEESGYMSRAVFITDKIMRKFGLSGKSVIPLISGTACAVPAVMATRNIDNWKERLITILVTPFTTCSARLPVYLIIISLVIPKLSFWGVSYQALTLFVLYLVGFLAAIGAAFVLNKILKIKSEAVFVVEMPDYKLPSYKNVANSVWESTKGFVWGAGKIILALSIVLWFLASNGFSDDFKNADQIVHTQFATSELSTEEMNARIESHRLEHSYIGSFSRTIEPVIKPLGYDWKIGVALITSFAAREVFVGTLATIYNVGSDDHQSIKGRMQNETRSDGKPLFNLATGLSLLVFYAFAMQCMSTLAVVKKETGTWKWPMLQLVFMTGLAYLSALVTYQTLA